MRGFVSIASIGVAVRKELDEPSRLSPNRVYSVRAHAARLHDVGSTG